MSTNPPTPGQGASGPPDEPAPATGPEQPAAGSEEPVATPAQPEATSQPAATGGPPQSQAPGDATPVPPAPVPGSPAAIAASAPPAPPAEPPSPPTGWAAAGGDGWPQPAHPVTLTFDEAETQNRLWGIPLLGILGRGILLIPHAVILWLLAIAVGFIVFFVWIPILLVGRVPDGLRDFLAGFYRWYNRVWAYLTLLTGRYPPFSLGGDHPVRTEFGPNPAISRWWGIPFISAFVRWLILIPHYVALWILGIVVGFAFLVSWFPVLVDGRMATWGYQLFGGWLRWTTRVTAYAIFVTDTYPPFTINN